MEWIADTESLAQACAKLRQAEFVAVDTEFMRESTFWPQLCLIQAAGDDTEVLIDPLAEGLDLQPFYDLLTDQSVIKVFNACRIWRSSSTKAAGSFPSRSLTARSRPWPWAWGIRSPMTIWCGRW